MTDEEKKTADHADAEATLVVDGRKVWDELDARPRSDRPEAAASLDDAWDTPGPPTNRAGYAVLTPAAPPPVEVPPLDPVPGPVADALGATPSPPEAVPTPHPAETSPSEMPTAPPPEDGIPFLDSDLLQDDAEAEARAAQTQAPAAAKEDAVPSQRVTPVGLVVPPAAETNPSAVDPAPPRSMRRGPSAVEMEDLFSSGDYAGALAIAEELLARDSTHVDALDCVERSRAALRASYQSSLGPLDRVPVLAITQDQLRWLTIDHRAGFILSHVDGISNLEEIIDISGMRELDALAILAELATRKVIGFR